MPLSAHQSGGLPLERGGLQRWLQSPRARRLLALETRELQRVLPEIFGRHVLQVGSWGRGTQLIGSAETLHRAVLGTVSAEGASALIDPEHLPLMSRSVDAVLLPHTLEFSPSPHNVLREADRVLNDRGRLFLLGFNPWGLWSLRARLGLPYTAYPPGARAYSVGRLADWLKLLDFEVMQVRRFSTGFPWGGVRSDGEPWSPGSLLQPLREAYLLVAKKRVLPMNFIGRVRRAQVKPLIGMPVGARSQASFEKSDV